MYDKYFQIRRQKQRMQLGGEKRSRKFRVGGFDGWTNGLCGIRACVYVYGFTVTEKFVLALVYLWERLRLTDG